MGLYRFYPRQNPLNAFACVGSKLVFLNTLTIKIQINNPIPGAPPTCQLGTPSICMYYESGPAIYLVICFSQVEPACRVSAAGAKQGYRAKVLLHSIRMFFTTCANWVDADSRRQSESIYPKLNLLSDMNYPLFGFSVWYRSRWSTKWKAGRLLESEEGMTN